jgi:hypothetical protein
MANFWTRPRVIGGRQTTLLTWPHSQEIHSSSSPVTSGQPNQVIIHTTIRRSPVVPIISLIALLFIFLIFIAGISAIQNSADHYNACRLAQTPGCEQVR